VRTRSSRKFDISKPSAEVTPGANGTTTASIPISLANSALCPFGGAGPLHCAELASEMGIDAVVVPLAPGVTSALGLLMSNLREDRVRTEVALLDRIAPERIQAIVTELDGEARDRLRFAAEYGLQTKVKLGLRYLGQGYDLAVDIALDPLDLNAVAAAFHAAHERQYGFARHDQSVELVNIWVSVEVDLGAARLPEIPAIVGPPEPISNRPVVFRGQTYATPVFQRRSLGADARITGPAIVEQLDATTVVWPEQQGEVDRFGQLILGPIPENA
jgi:N-methylhydantoinase A